MRTIEFNKNFILVENNEGFVHMMTFENDDDVRPYSNCGFLGYHGENTFVLADYCTLTGSSKDNCYQMAKEFVKNHYANVVSYNNTLKEFEKTLNNICITNYAKKYPTLESLKEVIDIEKVKEKKHLLNIQVYYEYKFGHRYGEYNKAIFNGSRFYSPAFALQNFEKNEQEIFNAFMEKFNDEKRKNIENEILSSLCQMYQLEEYNRFNNDDFENFICAMFDNYDKKTFKFEFDCKELLKNFNERVTNNLYYKKAKDDSFCKDYTAEQTISMVADLLKERDTITFNISRTNICLSTASTFLVNIDYNTVTDVLGDDIFKGVTGAYVAVFNDFKAVKKVMNGRKTIYSK